MIGHIIKLYVMCDEDMVAKSVTVGTPLTTPLTTVVPVVCSRSCAPKNLCFRASSINLFTAKMHGAVSRLGTGPVLGLLSF